MSQLHFLMAGGGTGGHVMPAIAVARELHARGHAVTFLGTRSGLEARLVPEAGFLIEWVQIGGLNRVGLLRKLRSLWQLPLAIGRASTSRTLARSMFLISRRANIPRSKRSNAGVDDIAVCRAAFHDREPTARMRSTKSGPWWLAER